MLKIEFLVGGTIFIVLGLIELFWYFKWRKQGIVYIYGHSISKRENLKEYRLWSVIVFLIGFLSFIFGLLLLIGPQII